MPCMSVLWMPGKLSGKNVVFNNYCHWLQHSRLCYMLSAKKSQDSGFCQMLFLETDAITRTKQEFRRRTRGLRTSVNLWPMIRRDTPEINGKLWGLVLKTFRYFRPSLKTKKDFSRQIPQVLGFSKISLHCTSITKLENLQNNVRKYYFQQFNPGSH